MVEKVKDAGFSSNTITPETYFRQLGLKPMGCKAIERVSSKLGNPELTKAFHDALRRGDVSCVREVLATDHRLLQLAYCGDYYNLCSKAHLITNMPIRQQSYILDFGMDDAMPMAFWKAAHRDCYVTSLNNHYELGTKWARKIGESRIIFSNNTLANFLNTECKPLDVVIFSNGWESIFEGIIDEVVPPSRTFSAKAETDDQLLSFFKRIDQVLIPEGLIIFEVPPHHDFGLLANTCDLTGIFPNWILNMALHSLDERNRHCAMIFSRSQIPPFAQENLEALAAKGKISDGSAYFAESAHLFRRFFEDSELVFKCEYQWLRTKTQVQAEFWKKGELGLFYKTTSSGGNAAQLLPADQVLPQLESFQSFLTQGERQGALKLKSNFNG